MISAPAVPIKCLKKCQKKSSSSSWCECSTHWFRKDFSSGSSSTRSSFIAPHANTATWRVSSTIQTFDHHSQLTGCLIQRPVVFGRCHYCKKIPQRLPARSTVQLEFKHYLRLAALPACVWPQRSRGDHGPQRSDYDDDKEYEFFFASYLNILFSVKFWMCCHNEQC